MPLSVTMHRLILFLRHAHFVKAKLEIFQKCSEINVCCPIIYTGMYISPGVTYQYHDTTTKHSILVSKAVLGASGQ